MRGALKPFAAEEMLGVSLQRLLLFVVMQLSVAASKQRSDYEFEALKECANKSCAWLVRDSPALRIKRPVR